MGFYYLGSRLWGRESKMKKMETTFF